MNAPQDIAIKRLKFWREARAEAERANDTERAASATQFIDQYNKLIASLMAGTPTGSV